MARGNGAARLPKLPEDVRAKIRVSAILHRLQGYALNECDPVTKEPIFMSMGQITAAVALLKKCLPDLASVEVSGQINHHYVLEGAAEAVDAPAWLAQAQIPDQRVQ